MTESSHEQPWNWNDKHETGLALMRSVEELIELMASRAMDDFRCAVMDAVRELYETPPHKRVTLDEVKAALVLVVDRSPGPPSELYAGCRKKVVSKLLERVKQISDASCPTRAGDTVRSGKADNWFEEPDAGDTSPCRENDPMLRQHAADDSQ